ncbi:MAG: hypothetical protein SGILL_009274 [Bacillariaceae sp.]
MDLSISPIVDGKNPNPSSSSSLLGSVEADTMAPRSFSPACRPSFNGKTNITRIMFSHTRKAGGTTLRNFLKGVAQQMGWEFVPREGSRVEYPNRTDTLYVVNLRDPVARVISNYKYDGRWNCNNLRNPKYNASYDDETPFEEWWDFHKQATVKGNCKPPSKHLWTCVDECYLRWYGDEFNCVKKFTSNYQQALARLLKYDILVPTSFLKDKDYVAGLESMFDNLGNEKLRKKQEIYCSPESYYWNDQLPMKPIPNATMDEVVFTNQLDTKLHNLLSSCPNGMHFPDRLDKSLYFNNQSNSE